MPLTMTPCQVWIGGDSESRSLTIAIPMHPPNLNSKALNAAHWSKRHKIKQTWNDLIGLSVRWPHRPMLWPVMVRYTWIYELRRPDWDNVATSLKLPLDALELAGVLENDADVEDPVIVNRRRAAPGEKKGIVMELWEG